jgi:hypothetical protein
MPKVEHTSNRTASRRLVRAVNFLTLAGRALCAASQASSDRYHKNKFHRLAIGVRELTLPLTRIASLLDRGGER